MSKANYPFRRFGPAESPTVDVALAIERDDSASGAPRRALGVPKGFVAKMREAVAEERAVIADSLTQRFIHAQVERKASTNEVLRGALRQVRKAPSRRSLERMQAVANEVGRRRGGGRALRNMLTQEVVDEIIARSAEQ